MRLLLDWRRRNQHFFLTSAEHTPKQNLTWIPGTRFFPRTVIPSRALFLLFQIINIFCSLSKIIIAEAERRRRKPLIIIRTDKDVIYFQDRFLSTTHLMEKTQIYRLSNPVVM